MHSRSGWTQTTVGHAANVRSIDGGSPSFRARGLLPYNLLSDIAARGLPFQQRVCEDVWRGLPVGRESPQRSLGG